MSHHRDFPIGARVELHPATDDWMRGDRHGTIVGYGRKPRGGHHPIRVKLDRSGRTKRFHQANLTVVATNAPLKGARPIGSNMTEVEHGDLTVLYSYETPVAFLSPQGGYRTEKKWSVTTSKHIGKFFARHGYDLRGAFKIPQDDLARFVEAGALENPRRPRKAPTYSRNNLSVDIWEERDRLHVELYAHRTGEPHQRVSTVAEWWDDDARQMFEDGFFDARRLEDSVIEYVQSVGIAKVV